MEKDLMNALGALSGQLATVSQDARTAAARSQEAAYGVTQLRGDFVELRRDVDHLKAAVFGSDPPPESPPTAISRQVSEHDSELATLAGQVIATNAKVDTTIAKVNKLTEMQQEQTETLKSIKDAVGGFLSHPKVRRLAYLAYIGIVGYLATRGVQ